MNESARQSYQNPKELVNKVQQKELRKWNTHQSYRALKHRPYHHYLKIDPKQFNETVCHLNVQS